MDSPTNDPASTLVSILNVTDILFTSLFVLELALKVIVMGLWQGNGMFDGGQWSQAYLRRGWNILDCTVVAASVATLATSGGGALGSLKALRTLRVLRALRVIARHEGMRLAVTALLNAVPAIINVIFLLFSSFFLFSLIFVSLYKGGFSSCQGVNSSSLSDLQWSLITSPVPFTALNTTSPWANSGATGWGVTAVAYTGSTSRAVCEWLGCQWWPVIPQSFDNVGVGLVSLLTASTNEGWNQIFYAAVDSMGADMQPIRDNNMGIFFVFALFMIIGCFFMMNLFIGVVIENFNRLKVRTRCVCCQHNNCLFDLPTRITAAAAVALNNGWCAMRAMQHVFAWVCTLRVPCARFNPVALSSRCIAVLAAQSAVVALNRRRWVAPGCCRTARGSG
jgi:voltage-dependent calcium channel L type alpha-1D